MDKIVLTVKSRTFWTIAAMFLIGGVHGVTSFLPAGLLPVVEGALGLLATYFHVNPSQNYQN